MNEELLDRLERLHISHMRELGRLGADVALHGEDCILLYLRHIRRPLLSGDITRLTGLTTGRVANILKQLEKKNWIVRTQDTEDQRRVYISLTEKGMETAGARREAQTNGHRDILEYLGEEDAATAVRLFEKCLDYYGACRRD